MEKNKILKQIVFCIFLIYMGVLFIACSPKKNNEHLYTDSGQAWVYEKGNHKIAFTLTPSGYKNYIFDFELDVVGSAELGFHTDKNIFYFHHKLYDSDGNYLGIWGDSLFIAENPCLIPNSDLYEYKIRGNKLTITKPVYSYIDPDQAEDFDDVSYKFTKKNFTPPSSSTHFNFSNLDGGSKVMQKIEHSYSKDHDYITFYLETSEHEDEAIYIYDMKGVRINTLYKENGISIWNMRDYEGKEMPSSAYFILHKTNESVWVEGVVLLR